MIRSMILAVAIAGAVGCVAQDDQTASVEQNTGGGGLFSCSNHNWGSITGVQCVAVPVNIDVKNVSALSGNDLDVLSNDLNNLNIDVGDINILNYSSILSNIANVTKNDFLNHFGGVANGDTCAGVLFLGIVCK